MNAEAEARRESHERYCELLEQSLAKQAELEEEAAKNREKKRIALNVTALRQRRQTRRERCARNYWRTWLRYGRFVESWVVGISDEVLETMRVVVFQKNPRLVQLASGRDDFEEGKKRHGRRDEKSDV